MEKKYTLINDVLTKELANYKIHYVYPQQFWYSSWGYGGSTEGLSDGMTFQLGKINILFIVLSMTLSSVYLYKKKSFDNYLKSFYLFVFLFVFSLFMTTSFSSLIWDNLKYLWYLQFPWRFLSFSNFFIALIGSYVIFFTKRLFDLTIKQNKTKEYILLILTVAACLLFVFKYNKYFRPQSYIRTNDSEKTSFEEIAWRISNTSFEFIPKGVRTKKSQFNTTILDINKNEISGLPYKIISGQGKVNLVENKLAKKTFFITTGSLLIFQINTYNFPGWHVYLDNQKIKVNDNNKLKLITAAIPEGNHQLEAVFLDTPIRKLANFISLISFVLVIFLWRLKSTSAGRRND